jgi:hypothetical protein
MKKTISIIIAIALVGFLIYGVAFHKKKIPVEKPGKVTATAAYEKYFGSAPTVDKGSAYAFVIYFPSAKESGKIVPFPFFTFDESSQIKVAVERLLSGMDVDSYQGEFLSVASGSRLLSLSDDQGTLTLSFSKELNSAHPDEFVRALKLTVRQFNGVKDIHFQIDGKDMPLPALANGSVDSAVQQPGPPRLLSVTAMRDKGASKIEDVNVFFDRPVDVKELKLLSKDGKKYEGDVFHSVFDMSAVLKPKDPSQFKERVPIRVGWKVVDKLGRTAEGDNIWLLEIKEH